MPKQVKDPAFSQMGESIELPLSEKQPLDAAKIKILRLPEVVSRIGLKRSSIYQRIKTGDFPQPMPLGPRAVGWLEHEIDAWLKARMLMRR